MSVDSRPLQWVALGESRARAGRVFLTMLDDVELSTYEAATAGLSVESPRGLALAAGAGQAAAINDLLGQLEFAKVRVELPVHAADRDAIVQAVRESGWAVTELVPSAAGTWVACLDRVERDEPVLPFVVRREAPADVDAAPTAPTVTGRQGAPSRPGRPGLVAKVGRRRLALLALAVVAVLAIAGLTAIVATTSAGLGGITLLLVLGSLGLQAVSLCGVAYLARHARRTRVHRDEIDMRILRRIRVLDDRTKKTREQLRRQDRAVQRKLAGISSAVDGLSVQGSRGQTEARETARRLQLAVTRQVQALGQLERLVKIDGTVPPMGGWAASPDLVVLVLERLLQDRPKTVVEFGSGTTTLFMALLAEQHGLDCTIVSYDHDEQFADSTRRMLEAHGVAHRAEVRFAPLQDAGLPHHDTQWYATQALKGLEDVGLVIVDGPPESTGEQARYPALPLLVDCLAPHAVVVMDDLIRPEDAQTARRWVAEYPDFTLMVRNDLEKYAGILTRGV